MARDNSPWERQRKQLERKLNRRASYDRILIVSEGSKTEPNYFREIRAANRLHTANVAVQPSEMGTSSIQVVKYAKELFDRDDHASYFDALTLAASLDGKLRNDNKQPVIFKAIASVPSFDLWLLLHYEDIQAPLHRDEVIQRLKQYFPGYEKGVAGTFATTRQHLDIATLRAGRLATRATAYDDPEPFTAIAELVLLLTNLRSSQPQ